MVAIIDTKYKTALFIKDSIEWKFVLKKNEVLSMSGWDYVFVSRAFAVVLSMSPLTLRVFGCVCTCSFSSSRLPSYESFHVMSQETAGESLQRGA